MGKENICHFIPYDKDHGQLSTINFVLETKPQPFTALKTEAVYKMHLVCHGHGKLHTLGTITPLHPGDVFFTFPAEAFAIEGEADLEYMYISFLGSRGHMLLQRLKIDRHHAVLHTHSSLQSFWRSAIETNSQLPALAAESVLLFTFAHLGQTRHESSHEHRAHAWEEIKKYIDDHFTDPSLTLKTIGDELGYNAKYICSVFKKHTGLGTVEYLHMLRIRHARNLIAQGFTSIGDISSQSGFSDPQYFSKVFKKQLHLTPAQFIRENK